MAEENKEEVKKEEVKETGTKKVNKNLWVIIIVAIAILVGLSLLGKYLYQKIAEKAAGTFLSKVTGQNVDIGSNGKDITVKTKEGDLKINSGGSLPDSFPKDFPVYPGTTLTGSFSASGTGDDKDSKGTSIVWETGDDAAKVGAFYKTELPKAGYTILSDYSQDDATTLTFENDSVSGFIGVGTGNEGKTTISVTVGTK